MNTKTDLVTIRNTRKLLHDQILHLHSQHTFTTIIQSHKMRILTQKRQKCISKLI